MTTTLTALGVLAILPLWGIFRLILLAGEYNPAITVPGGLYAISSWILRIFLIIVALTGAGYAGFVLFLAIAWSSSSRSDSAFPFVIGVAGVGLYCLSAVVLHFPGFPVKTHLALFFPCQLILISTVAFLPAWSVFLTILAVSVVFFLLWMLCLRDRIRAG